MKWLRLTNAHTNRPVYVNMDLIVEMSVVKTKEMIDVTQLYGGAIAAISWEEEVRYFHTDVLESPEIILALRLTEDGRPWA